MARKAPLIVVLGATACGKSRLAIELAQRFRGEIISADSMQVYKGLSIVTNKVTQDEMQQAKHHMIDFLDPFQRYSVIDFRNKSLNIISNLHKQEQLPIVVGGTNYYIESLIWKAFLIDDSFDNIRSDNQRGPESTLLDDEISRLRHAPDTEFHNDEDFTTIEKFFSKPIYHTSFSDTDCLKLWKILEQVDTTSAHLYHPNDKRRIIRALQIIQRSSRKLTDILSSVNKSNQTSQSSLGGPLRFDSTCVLWLDCDKDQLGEVLDARVDQMLERGLLGELRDFHSRYNIQRSDYNTSTSYTKGVFQTIGFKEFHDYVILDKDEQNSDKGQKILKSSIDALKLSTRQYAKRQLKWVKRRFMHKGTRDLPLLFRLTTAFDEHGWRDKVQQNAFNIVERFLSGQEMVEPDLLELKQDPQEQETVNKPAKHYCEICSKLLIGSHHIHQHLAGRMHRKRQQYIQQQERLNSCADATAT